MFILLLSLVAAQNGINNRPNTKTDAIAVQPFNPLQYANLIQPARCPEYPDRSDCTYPSTLRNASLGTPWTCEAGSFCLSPNSSVLCTGGFYCPANAAQAIFCPRGYFCDPSAKFLTLCPKNKFCPIGSTVPQGCHYLAYCPEGSYQASKLAVVALFAGASLFMYFVFAIKKRGDIVRDEKHKRELENLLDPTFLEEKPQLARLDRTFDIEFENLGLKLESGIEIMKNVSGTLRAGRTCAIMGPSGSGKTTFVTLLTGKVRRTSGTVKVNGHVEELSKYRKLIGYVPQEDVMLRELTVRDILMHSARMRLPRDWPYKKVKAKVLEIISFLGLSHVAQSVIGNEEERGISGGQRKRVNIGMELVAEPSVLFLDEPTSGLDSSTSLELCANLRNIAQQQGLLVAAVVHSPSPETFREFDDLLLLGKGGRIIYMGPRVEAPKYFDKIGFPLPDHASPSDYYMEIVSGKIPSLYDPSFAPAKLMEYWEHHINGTPLFQNRKRMMVRQATVARKDYHSSSNLKRAVTVANYKPKKQSTLSHIISGFAGSTSDILNYWIDVARETGDSISSIFISDDIRITATFTSQLWFLMKRAFSQLYRNSEQILINMVLNFASGVFISVAVQKFDYLGASPNELCLMAPWNNRASCFTAFDNIKQAGMFICLGAFFAGISVGTNTFGREKVVFWRDSASGMSAIPYYIAKVTMDIPRIVLGSSMYSMACILVFPYRQNFWNIFLLVVMLYMNAFAIGYWISIVFNQSSAALVGTGMSLLFSVGLSGVVPDLDEVFGSPANSNIPGVILEVKDGYPKQLQYIWSLSAPRWAIEAFWLKEVDFRPFMEKNLTPTNHYVRSNCNL
ncbi:hypothetical protein BC833DRAFT_593660 [Globomyces pollinis-pini]|nr:hypothetical protein BC833DRAFT_593660 [Globomyces pollinis-pini]